MGLFSIPQAEFSAAVQALTALETEGEDKAARALCIAKITPVVRKLRSGRMLEQQIHKLINANNPARAVKLLQAMGPRKRYFGMF